MVAGEARELEELIAAVRTEPDASFYREHWGSAASFSELPSISREDLLRVPLSRRRYKNVQSMVKIVHDAERVFLSEWAFEDIGSEPWGLLSARPVIYMTNPYEAIEKSMWCYGNTMLPLICESDPELAAGVAEQYRADSLIADPVSLKKLRDYLSRRTEKLAALTIISDAFDIPTLIPFTAFAERTRLVLALPECGAFAEKDAFVDESFRLLPGCILEKVASDFLLTKSRMLVTPIIRYRIPLVNDISINIRNTYGA